MTYRPDVCLWHANCLDGFTAAWAIWKRWPDVEFIPAQYGDPPAFPWLARQHVLLVDFSYKRAVLESIACVAESVRILDHHRSALNDLGPYIADASALLAGWAPGVSPFQIMAHFDMTKSGAQLAWEYAHPGQTVPRIVQHVQDRDLWRFEVPGTRAVCAALASYPFTFEAWDKFAGQLEHDRSYGQTIREGDAINRAHAKDIDEMLALTTRTMFIGGYLVPVANLPKMMASDAANKLSIGQPFGATYFDGAHGDREFSLRSSDGGVDVSKIAESFGGGGHAKAAGFRVARGWEGE